MYTDFDTLKTMLRVAHSPATFGVRRAMFADGLLFLVASFGAVNRLAERIDDKLYAEYHEQPLGKPVYIVAAPRSGTTFLHRLMSHDPQFTTFKLYQTAFPTITGYKVFDRLARVNGSVGRALLSIRQRIDSSSFGGWEGKHDTGVAQEEEDEALWALALSTVAIWLVLPFPDEFEHLRFIDRLPADKREKLVTYYRRCLQRHLFYNQGKTLLGKNVLLPGRFEIVNEAVPEARFVHILRHPYEAVPSTLSLFTIPWRWHSPELRLDGPQARALADLTIDYYRYLHTRSVDNPRFYNVTYRDLLADPIAHVRTIYERFELELNPQSISELERMVEQQKSWKSDHQYSLEQFGLTKDYVYERLKDVFDSYGFAR